MIKQLNKWKELSKNDRKTCKCTKFVIYTATGFTHETYKSIDRLKVIFKLWSCINTLYQWFKMCKVSPVW